MLDGFLVMFVIMVIVIVVTVVVMITIMVIIMMNISININWTAWRMVGTMGMNHTAGRPYQSQYTYH